MIQRIQSVFLLLASGCAGGMFALPLATTDKTVTTSANFSDAVYNVQDHVGLMILFGAAALLTLISIFVFKDRKKQLLLDRLAIVANVIGLILGVILFMNDRAIILDQGVNVEDGFGLYLPFLFFLFVILAIRYINKDQKLVSSMDRLR